jgi:cell division transport system permease protein
MKALAVRAHALREMARLIRRRPGSFLIAVLLAGAAFTVPLAAASIARSAAPLVEQLPLGPEINLFLAASASTAEIRQLQSQLAGRTAVARVDWITRDAALKALARRTGSGGLADLKTNPLPDVLVVTLSPQTTPAEVESVLGELRRLPRVESVAADTGWHRQLRGLLRTAAVAGTLVGGLVLALLVLVVLASVLLQLTASAEYVRALRLVGADTRFIVRPFAYSGALTLGLGMLAAAGLTWAGLATAAPPAAELVRIYGAELDLQPLPPLWLAALVAGATILGGLIAALAGRRALRRAR